MRALPRAHSPRSDRQHRRLERPKEQSRPPDGRRLRTLQTADQCHRPTPSRTSQYCRLATSYHDWPDTHGAA